MTVIGSVMGSVSCDDPLPAAAELRVVAEVLADRMMVSSSPGVSGERFAAADRIAAGSTRATAGAGADAYGAAGAWVTGGANGR